MKMAFVGIVLLIVFLRTQELSALRMERENQIQCYLISTEPPYDNYYNISKAVYPSLDLPSLLIKITVKFLATAEHTCKGGSSRTVNSSNSSISKQSAENKTTTYKFTWSSSCLYISGGSISLKAMNVFSLWAIFPNRRERQLHLTLPQFCGGFSSDTMIYFLSTLQDIAVGPRSPDPRLNTAECVILDDGKTPSFPGLKNLFQGVSWCFLFISLVFSQLVSQWLMVELKHLSAKKDESGNIQAVMLLSFIVFLLGLALNCIACYYSTSQLVYPWVFLASVMFVLFRRALCCICTHDRRETGCIKFYKYFNWFTLTEGHNAVPSKNAISFLALYPAVFMAFHHLLWILPGIITEPFWGISVLVAVLSVSAALFFLTREFYKDLPPRHACSFSFVMSLFLVGVTFFAFLLLVFVLLVVAQSFLSENIFTTLVQNVLVFFATLWLKYAKLDPQQKTKRKEGEGEDTPLQGMQQG